MTAPAQCNSLWYEADPSVAPRFSIIINNHNYGRFLRDTIESCLRQDYRNVEVIVVDDGSSDESIAIIGEFADRIRAVLKRNGGQASAFNAGFAESRGDFILFLDADDALASTAVSRFVAGFHSPLVSRVQARMQLIGERGQPLGRCEPEGLLPEGDWRSRVLEWGPGSYPCPPTSGNAWRRDFLEIVLPMPEDYVIAADGYLRVLAPLFGMTASIQEPVVRYRVHGGNTSYWGWKSDPGGRLERDTLLYERMCRDLSVWSQRLGHERRAEGWIEKKWQHLLRKHVLSRLTRDPKYNVPLPLLVRAARQHFGKAWKKPFVMSFILAVYAAPAPLALKSVLWLFRKNRIGYGLRLTGGAA